ncbi:MAG TPA: hypothetical protein VMU04_02685 [Candidatus Acidoferrum sp.]|nr:hypothetical protein [Candidatus Acidoferrum sp.]
MNLLYAEVVSVSEENGARRGRVRIRGALSTVPLELVPEAQAGDTVLLCDGVAIGAQTRLKGANNTAQGNALGNDAASGVSPEGATE